MIDTPSLSQFSGSIPGPYWFWPRCCLCTLCMLRFPHREDHKVDCGLNPFPEAILSQGIALEDSVILIAIGTRDLRSMQIYIKR
jgi:hypothetical protein